VVRLLHGRQAAKLTLSDLVITPKRIREYLRGHGTAGEVDLLASHLGLINVDLELATELGGASLEQAKRNYLRVHRRLAQGIEGLSPGSYDFVLIDCPPNFNVVTKTAIVASDGILIPAKPDYLSTLGIDYLLASLKNLVKDYNDFLQVGGASGTPIDPRLIGVVFTMIQEYGKQPISALRPFIAQTRSLGVPVFDAYIKENKTLFADAQYGMPVVLDRPTMESHQSVVQGLEEVVTEFQAKVLPPILETRNAQ
jgi:chromosome partitioning protein